jgi:hypothetical protein
MKLMRTSLALVALGALTGIAVLAQQVQKSGTGMADAAQGLLASLTAEQKTKAVFAFDSNERTNWNFIPLQNDMTRKTTRKGIALEEMTPEQKKAALALVKAGTSESGNAAVSTIMSLEGILLAQEGAKGKMVRNPGWYFFTVFGDPSKTGKWGWRVEGHHLSLNFTLEGQQVVSSTPAFFGSNPAEIKTGQDKGKRILPAVEDLARTLYKSLDADQQKIALQAKPFDEPGQKTLTPKLGDPVGLAAAKMTADQKATLMKLLESYTSRMPADVAAQEMSQVTQHGIDKVHFAFTGSPEPGKGFTYRVHGPSFVVEFLNIQADSAGNPANHIHSAWRRVKGDFGL